VCIESTVIGSGYGNGFVFVFVFVFFAPFCYCLLYTANFGIAKASYECKTKARENELKPRCVIKAIYALEAPAVQRMATM